MGHAQFAPPVQQQQQQQQQPGSVMACGGATEHERRSHIQEARIGSLQMKNEQLEHQVEERSKCASERRVRGRQFKWLKHDRALFCNEITALQHALGTHPSADRGGAEGPASGKESAMFSLSTSAFVLALSPLNRNAVLSLQCQAIHTTTSMRHTWKVPVYSGHWMVPKHRQRSGTFLHPV